LQDPGARRQQRPARILRPASADQDASIASNRAASRAFLAIVASDAFNLAKVFSSKSLNIVEFRASFRFDNFSISVVAFAVSDLCLIQIS